MEGQVMKKPIISIGMNSEKTVEEEKQNDDSKLGMQYNGSHINEDEDRKVDCMRKLVQKHDPSVKVTNKSYSTMILYRVTSSSKISRS